MPLARYRSQVESGVLERDVEQVAVMERLDRIAVALARRGSAGTPSGSRLARWLGFGRGDSAEAPQAIEGLYLWGGVGRGKTYLCDLFFEALEFDDKLRLHFHRFMRRVHGELRALGEVDDPLPRIADRLAGETRLLLLDEMHVNDITDAMLLGRLLDGLFARGVTLVTTSNVPPDGLYKDGLQRQRFVPAIEAIKTHCEVLEMGEGDDYRLKLLAGEDTYLVADFERGRAPSAVDERLTDWFERLRRGPKSESDTLEVNGRELPIRACAGDLVWMTFQTLCSTPRSTHDYIELATDFKTLILADVPVLDDTRNDEARRLVNLIDELYDRRTALIVSAEANPPELYTGKRLAFEFQRTASRLIEMQTEAYLSRSGVETGEP